MKRKMLIMRIIAIIALALVAFVGIFSEPNDELHGKNLVKAVAISKGVGFLAAGGVVLLVATCKELRKLADED